MSALFRAQVRLIELHGRRKRGGAPQPFRFRGAAARVRSPPRPARRAVGAWARRPSRPPPARADGGGRPGALGESLRWRLHRTCRGHRRSQRRRLGAWGGRSALAGGAGRRRTRRVGRSLSGERHELERILARPRRRPAGHLGGWPASLCAARTRTSGPSRHRLSLQGRPEGGRARLRHRRSVRRTRGLGRLRTAAMSSPTVPSVDHRWTRGPPCRRAQLAGRVLRHGASGVPPRLQPALRPCWPRSALRGALQAVH